MEVPTIRISGIKKTCLDDGITKLKMNAIKAKDGKHYFKSVSNYLKERLNLFYQKEQNLNIRADEKIKKLKILRVENKQLMLIVKDCENLLRYIRCIIKHSRFITLTMIVILILSIL